MKIDFIVSAAEDIDFPDEYFDVITACQCFFYFDYDVVIPKLAKLLKKGGRFLVINWEDTPQEINVDWSIAGNPAEAKDFWSGKIEKCSSKVMLAPHSCKLWEY